MEQVIIKLKEELQKTLPGQDVQYRMAPVGRAKYKPGNAEVSDYKSSAVMILFCVDKNNHWFLPLTQRFSYNGAHSGQISFPGGKYDPTDLSLKDTALRECYEEIGVKENIEVVGSLTNLNIPVSGYLVSPFVGICTTREPLFVPNAREVKSIIRLGINDLLNESTIKNGMIEVEGVNNFKIETPYFNIETYKIWGATAMILSELKEVIRPIF